MWNSNFCKKKKILFYSDITNCPQLVKITALFSSSFSVDILFRATAKNRQLRQVFWLFLTSLMSLFPLFINFFVDVFLQVNHCLIMECSWYEEITSFLALRRLNVAVGSQAIVLSVRWLPILGRVLINE